MRPGETKLIECPECQAQYRLTYEPGADLGGDDTFVFTPQPACHCPFCGGDLDDDSDELLDT